MKICESSKRLRSLPEDSAAAHGVFPDPDQLTPRNPRGGGRCCPAAISGPLGRVQQRLRVDRTAREGGAVPTAAAGFRAVNGQCDGCSHQQLQLAARGHWRWWELQPGFAQGGQLLPTALEAKGFQRPWTLLFRESLIETAVMSTRIFVLCEPLEAKKRGETKFLSNRNEAGLPGLQHSGLFHDRYQFSVVHYLLVFLQVLFFLLFFTRVTIIQGVSF